MLVSLDDRALLALMLTRGRSGAEPDRMAAGLFDRFGGLAAILSADLPELARIEGIGPGALLRLKLLRVLCERLARCEAEKRPLISTSSTLLAYLRIALADEPREQFRVLFLDRRNQLMRDELIAHESAYNPGVCSEAGACGLTQLMPATARELGVVDRLDPVDNLQGGADYLARQLVRFGDLRLALAAYNSGPSRVARLGRIPEIAETQSYVTSVIECYLALSAGRSVTNSRQCRRGELVQ